MLAVLATLINSSDDRLALGYRYANLGKVSFGRREPAYPYALRLGQLSSNEIYLSYTHVFKETPHGK